MPKGQKLYQKAKKLIPGGTQLLSKRPEMFLPDQWPAYYQKAKGVMVWDLDGKKYIDMSIMGIGACVLGYANKEVNQAVKKAIDLGSASTFNSYEEVVLAKVLIKLHPWAKMVRFARSGGEACAVAIRIARAYSQKDKVAFCGYHGWHDWYLSANLASQKNLDGQLLPGLNPAGVPRVLKGTALPFSYGKIEELEEIIKKHKKELGTIIMEVKRHKLDLAFLKKAQLLAKKNKIVFIFDETSSGFRLRAGGLHILYQLEPDMLILGKAMGNGYPISAVLGKRKVMQAAQKSFISSTFWTERIGFMAALETIRQYQKHKVEKHLISLGKYLKFGLKKIFQKNQLNIEVVGLASVPILKIKENNPLLIKTIFTQEMLKRGFLASTVIYLSLAHNKKIIDLYLKQADETFGFVNRFLRTKQLKELLKGPVCHSGFQRLA